MANHPNINWHRRWTMAADGRTLTHDNGLIVTWDGHRAIVNADTSQMVGEQIAADEGTDRHVGATIYKLLGQAETLFKKRNLQ